MVMKLIIVTREENPLNQEKSISLSYFNYAKYFYFLKLILSNI